MSSRVAIALVLLFVFGVLVEEVSPLRSFDTLPFRQQRGRQSTRSTTVTTHAAGSITTSAVSASEAHLQRTRCILRAASVSKDSDDTAGNDNTDSEWSDFPSPLPYESTIDSSQTETKLGIDIGRMLDPMTPSEADSLKAAATEIINDAVAAGLDDLSAVRLQLATERDEKSAQREQASLAAGQAAEAQLLSKIDALTDQFRATTDTSRTATQQAAAADLANSGTSMELGSWGRIGSQTVAMTRGDGDSTGSSGLLGSVSSAAAAPTSTKAASSSATRGILILADTTSDPYAKQLVDPLTKALRKELDDITLPVNVCKPTATAPLGGDNAAAVLIFCTSFTEASSIQAAMDRIFRTTLTGSSSNSVSQPPTQVVAITTLGTTRLEKVPYSLQNFMGGKLGKRRQMEEAIVRMTRDTARAAALDYTVCHVGELKDTKEAFQFRAGDAVDGALTVDTAVTVLTQAICLQPYARNATFSCAGKLNTDDDAAAWQPMLDDAFLRLDGPELLRFDLAINSNDYSQLVEYTKEWAMLLAESGRGLTTPIRAEITPSGVRSPPLGVTQQQAVKLLFLPTATGKNYVSKEDERQIATESGSKAATTTTTTPSNPKSSKDGGMEFVVEVTDTGALRARVKRCNYGDTVVIKELSEETILSSFRKCIEVWKKDHQN